MRTITGIQWLAIAGALCLLVLQITGGLEYTAGGSAYAQSSMVAAMVTVAFLPIFIEIARQGKAYGIATALAVAFVAFLIHSLPATVGRTNEVREVKAVEAKQSSLGIRLIEGELDKAQSRLREAFIEVGRECKTGFGNKCEGWRNSVVERQFRVDALTTDLKAARPKLGDMGSEAWAWTLGMNAETIRRLSALCFGFGLDVVIWSLMWFATSAKVRGIRDVAENKVEGIASPANELMATPALFSPMIENNQPPTPPKTKKRTKRQQKKDRVVASIRAYREKHGRAPPFRVVKARHRLPASTASRWRKQAMVA